MHTTKYHRCAKGKENLVTSIPFSYLKENKFFQPYLSGLLSKFLEFQN